jgi:PDZ domain
MRRFTSLRRPVLVALAVCFAAATALYSIIWMVHISRPPLELGVDFEISPTSHAAVVTRVYREGLARAAGVRTGDVIVAIDGRKMADPSPFYGYPYYKAVILGKQGDLAVLSVERDGVQGSLAFRVLLEPFRPKPTELSGWKDILGKVLGFYPLFFLIVGMAVLFLRLDDADAWRLAPGADVQWLHCRRAAHRGLDSASRAPLHDVVPHDRLGHGARSFQLLLLRLSGSVAD